MLTVLRDVVDQLTALEREVAELQGAVLPPATGLPGTTFDETLAVREQSQQAQRHSRELLERAAAMSARAEELMAEARRLTPAAHTTLPPRRRRHGPADIAAADARLADL